MPDVLIRCMAMPDRRTAELMHTERECDRHCENCDLVQDKDELIVAFREAIRVLETVANAVPLPEGHGRLIDADALDRAFTDLRFNSDGTLNHWGDRPGWCMHGYEVEKLIADAPTIVPAEWSGQNE